MLHTALRKRARVLAPIAVLVIFLTTVTAFAASQLITAKKGGTIDVAPGIKLVFRPKALEEDTVIFAAVSIRRNSIVYEFGPDGTTLSKPAKLIISREVLADAEVDDVVLYGEDGEEIAPEKNKRRRHHHHDDDDDDDDDGVVVYKLEHFSHYYHRRR